MKNKLIFAAVLIVVATLQFSFNNKSDSGFKVASSWWDNEYSNPIPAAAQISYTGYCETRICNKWSDEGWPGFTNEGEVYCQVWIVTRYYGQWCVDNYVLIKGSCNGVGAPC